MNERSQDWRSLLFVPADKPRLIEGAHKRSADAVILDLEDAVSTAAKPLARESLAEAVTQLRAHGLEVLVRVNAEPEQLLLDLQACSRAGVLKLMLPKVESVASLEAFETRLAAMTFPQGPRFEPTVIALIESPAAVLCANDIAAVPRVFALALGSEDFALSLRVEPSAACLTLPCQWLALAAAAHDKNVYGLPHSLADFSDLDALEAAAGQARAMGIHGALCIHPSQVPVINRAFAPTDADLNWARQIVKVWDATGGGVARLGETMIDRPIIERARNLLSRGVQP